MYRTMMQYNEFAPGYGFGSIYDYISESRYNNIDIILDYLKNNGKVCACAAGTVRDVIKGNITDIPEEIISDGKYVWNNSLMYYIEHYNLRLPHDVEEYILGKTK